MADGISESVTAPADSGPPEPEPQPYQPLSPLAVAAFALAAGYSAIVGVVGLIAMLNHTPLPLPITTLLWPVLAVGLAVSARYQIRRSEGTRSGLKLTSWALGLSVGVGIVYGMYYLGTFLAVRGQAQNFADLWLQKITAGKIEEAFFDSTKPPRKTVGSLRQTLELQYNTPPPEVGQRGQFSIFTSVEYVRLLELAGKNAQIEATGVRDWEYEQGGFTVMLTYRVTTDLASFTLQVKVHGAESPTGAYSGRQWKVVIEETGISGEGGTPGSPAYTTAGHELRKQATAGAAFANSWVEALSQGHYGTVFGSALAQQERLTYQKDLPRFFLGSVLVADTDALNLLHRLHKLRAGDLVQMEERVFWSPPGLRPTVETDAKTLFDPAKFKPRHLTLQPISVPVVRSDDKRLRFGYDVMIVVPRDDPTQPPLTIEGWVIVGADRDALQGEKANAEAWRVEALELVRGRNASANSRPGMPR